MRIASLSPAATEILFALGVENQIVCRDQFSNFPEETADIPKIMGHQDVNGGDLLDFEPDMLLTGTVVQQKLAEKLKHEGFSVLHQDPRCLEDVYGTIRQLGMVFEREEEAKELVQRMRKEFNTVKERARHLPKQCVYLEEWHHPPFACGNWVPEVASFAGAQAFPIPAGELSREVSLKDVQQFDPDMIVISWCGAGLQADPKLLVNRAGWDQLRAVQIGHIRVIDDSLLNRPGPRLVEGAQRIYGWLFEQASILF
ncbi:hypothetical protein COU77_00725 [Candidatus Peregrinibacteria bacterium CG10_big_fil_rev_8_21_14_0_10_49_16]|nr:MAG: hypothetical protein COW95_03860 [Candidatus Peregrinibacteria bacterium CG22_combo_CG10-13_8_21_14_all_49_11]PIR52351.1 MAG: hypothetical protein COU77_00725 [Candidatus Peregrinibacteria bacterium CG10_big_fil_rev_8_21_14_0_10_49_16]